jgi:intein/homing endonuclease
MSLSELCSNIITKEETENIYNDKNVMEFLTAPWGLALGTHKDVPPLYPAQKFIIKCYYGLELNEGSNRDIIIKDQFNEKELYRLNEKEYMLYLFNEGRINRLYEPGREYPNLVLVCGRRSGKCVIGNTLVLTDKGIIPIKDLGKSREEEFTDLDIGIVQEKERRARTKYFYNGGIKPVRKISTKSGFNITGTSDHLVKIMSSSGNIEWRSFGNIQIGDHIAINRKTDIWSTEYVNLDINNNQLKLEEKFGNLLGYLASDNYKADNECITFNLGCTETNIHLSNTLNSYFGKDATLCEKKREKVHSITFDYIPSEGYFKKIGYLFKDKRNTSYVPWSILRSPKSVVCSFLRGLFETNGVLNKKEKEIKLLLGARQIVHEVQLLLLNLGIISFVKKEKKSSFFALCIRGTNSIKLYTNLISFDSTIKRISLHMDLESDLEDKEIERIPYQKQNYIKWLNSISKVYKEDISVRKLFDRIVPNKGEKITYGMIRKCLEIIDQIHLDKRSFNNFQYILDAFYFYDPVISIELNDKQVYDLNVPDGSSFVANGMTNHNSTITSCIITYEVYKLLNKYCPQEYYGIMPEDPIKVTCISTSRDTASELFTKIVGHIERSEFFRKYRRRPTQQYIYLSTQRDIERYGIRGLASINIRVAPCSAKGLRGPGNIVVALDEMGFFFADEKSSNSVVTRDRNDEAIYKAATPSVAKFKSPEGYPDGKVICLSSPGPKSGKLYKEYERSFEEGNEDLFMIQAPTWEIDPNMSSQFLKNSYNANTLTFKSEYGAQFSDRLFGWIDDPDIVRKNVVKGLKIKERSAQRIPHFMGVDLGLKKDGTAITIGHWINDFVKGSKVEKIEVDYYAVRYASREGKDYFEPDEMVEWIASHAKRFYIAKGLFDQYYNLTMEPKLHKLGLRQFEAKYFNDSLNSIVYQMLLSCLLSRTLRLPEGEEVVIRGNKTNDSELVREILSLQAQQKSKYIIRVEAPQREDEHDDLSDSLARMVYIAHEYKNKSITYNITGSSAAGHLRMARMLRKTEMSKLNLNRPSTLYTGRNIRSFR